MRVAELDIEGIQPGDAAGETTLSASRLQVAVKGGRNFIVALDRGAKSRQTLIDALRGRPGRTH